jgi:hypothetical protein
MIGFIIEEDGWTVESSTEEEAGKLKTFRPFLESKGIIVEMRFHGNVFSGNVYKPVPHGLPSPCI